LSGEWQAVANTTVGRDIRNLAIQNNIQFRDAQNVLAKNYEKNKEAIEKELGRPIDPNNPQDAAEVFARFSLDRDGSIKPGKTMSPGTGNPLRMYGASALNVRPEDAEELFIELGQNILSFEKREERLEESIKAKFAQVWNSAAAARSGRQDEASSGFTKASPTAIGGGQVIPTPQDVEYSGYRLGSPRPMEIPVTSALQTFTNDGTRLDRTILQGKTTLNARVQYMRLMPYDAVNGRVLTQREYDKAVSEGRDRDIVKRWYAAFDSKDLLGGTDTKTITTKGLTQQQKLAIQRANKDTGAVPSYSSTLASGVANLQLPNTISDETTVTTTIEDEKLRDVRFYAPADELFTAGEMSGFGLIRENMKPWGGSQEPSSSRNRNASLK
jgi:hypothetical protein